MKNIKRAVIIAVIALAAVILIIYALKVAKINSIRIENPAAPARESALEIIDKSGSNDVLLADGETKRLYINPSTLNIKVEDKITGLVYNSIITDGAESEASIMNIKYTGEDNAFNTWDSFTYVLQTESFELERITDGVRINMRFNEGESAKYYEFMPHKMPIDRYDEVFVKGIDAAIENGTLDKKTGTKYKSTLRLVYSKSKQDNAYICNYVGAPPISAVRQLIEVTKLVGYTTDMLLEDSALFGYTVTFSDPPIFRVSLEAKLENDTLNVRIPSDSLVNENEFYMIQNIEVLPNFGLVKASDVTEGYLFVPDGCGALMKMNTYDSKVPDYLRPIYDNDYFQNYYYIPEFETELMMPVFGALLEESTLGKYGFMGIIKGGADISYIKAMLASSGEAGVGRQFNKIHPTYDVIQYKWVRVFGENNTNTATFLVTEPETSEDFEVSYTFYNDDVSYFKMAEDYREYLIASSDGRLSAASDKVLSEPRLYLEVLGTLSLNKRILGIPYNSEHSMTTYKELEDMINDLPDVNMDISYLGAFDEGMNNRLMNKGKLVSENGTEDELASLTATAQSRGITLYMGTDFTRVYQNGNGYFAPLHTLQSFNKKGITLYGYNLATGFAYKNTNTYTLLSPKYLPDVVNDFLVGVKIPANYYLQHLTNQYIAYYGSDYISPFESNELTDMAIEEFPKDSLLALDDPRADKIKYGSIAVNVSRKSCEHNSFYATVPFRELVLNGIIEYTTGTVNNNSTSPKLFMLEAIELGAIPKFTISHDGVDVLNDSHYTEFYSIEYAGLKQDILEVYSGFKAAMSKIGTAKITDHKMLAPEVFLTTYSSGVQVVTNYSALPYEYEGNTVMPKDNIIIERR